MVEVKSNGYIYKYNGDIGNWKLMAGWVTEMPTTFPESENQAVPVPEPPETTREPATGAIWPGMDFNDLLSFVKSHKHSEGWLFRNIGMTVDEAKADPYRAACEIKEVAGW